MKTLYILRHAKSSWSYPHLDDYDRPLGARGRKDVVRMSRYVKKHLAPPEIIVTSAASRAFYTALFMADAWKLPEEKVTTDARMYHADEEEIIQIISEQENHEILAVAGHNPGLTQLASALSGEYVENIPTCGVLGISFGIDHWEEIDRKKGKKKFFYYPKML